MLKSASEIGERNCYTTSLWYFLSHILVNSNVNEICFISETQTRTVAVNYVYLLSADFSITSHNYTEKNTTSILEGLSHSYSLIDALSNS